MLDTWWDDLWEKSNECGAAAKKLNRFITK